MSSTVPAFDPANVQGDILLGLPKKTEQYLFFQISDDVAGFKKCLADLIPLITTTTQVTQDRAKIASMKTAAREQNKAPQLLPMTGVNIAFSQAGLTKLGITDDLGDPAFKNGQLKDAKNLGDPGKDVNGTFDPDWLPEFKKSIHGVIIMSGNSDSTLADTRQKVDSVFNAKGPNPPLLEVTTITGNVRPNEQSGHEHFGFLDGISQPAVKGFNTNPNPGQQSVRQGFILCGREGDEDTPRPAWAIDGSIMAFRYLFQLVPEFDTFLKQNPIKAFGLTPEQGSELLGARLVGRWKSGAPVDLTPLQDDPALGKDSQRNDNFKYDPNSEDRCPFAAHSRKTNPRSDLSDTATEAHRIIRRGIQFGPEVTQQEADTGVSDPAKGRGLLFVCYQSLLSRGFQFIQRFWANNPSFPPKNVTPGFDAIIGQTNDSSTRTINGMDPKNPSGSLSLPVEWVVPKGGEYFFVPSIPALRTKFASSS
ncbi:peroxidase TAP [Trametes polyzona]|nr:peroxidase TAP [Trametes polyzona]